MAITSPVNTKLKFPSQDCLYTFFHRANDGNRIVFCGGVNDPEVLLPITSPRRRESIRSFRFRATDSAM